MGKPRGANIAAEIKISIVLEYLRSPKRRSDVEEKFSLSNTQSYNLLKWMRNANLIEESKSTVAGKGGIVWTYSKKKK